jgi:hypothetical protein
MDFITNLHTIVKENDIVIKGLPNFNNETIVKESLIQMNRINATKQVILPLTFGKQRNSEVIKIYEELTFQWGTIKELFEKALNS